jgi:predicted lactoylglutathione lyase
MALSFESRAAVDEMVRKAIAAGGSTYKILEISHYGDAVPEYKGKVLTSNNSRALIVTTNRGA